jgi:hypothetical protein
MTAAKVQCITDLGTGGYVAELSMDVLEPATSNARKTFEA